MALRDFENRYLDLLEQGFSELKSEVKANTRLTKEVFDQAKLTNGRVNKHETEINKLKRQVAKKRIIPEVDTKTLYLLALAMVILLAIVAKFSDVKIPGVL